MGFNCISAIIELKLSPCQFTQYRNTVTCPTARHDNQPGSVSVLWPTRPFICTNGSVLCVYYDCSKQFVLKPISEPKPATTDCPLNCIQARENKCLRGACVQSSTSKLDWEGSFRGSGLRSRLHPKWHPFVFLCFFQWDNVLGHGHCQYHQLASSL